MPDSSPLPNVKIGDSGLEARLKRAIEGEVLQGGVSPPQAGQSAEIVMKQLGRLVVCTLKNFFLESGLPGLK